MAQTKQLYDLIVAEVERLSSFARRGEIRVVGGAHKGASQPLGPSGLSIGSDLESDIVLLGDRLASLHARIEIVGPLGRKLKVEAHGDRVEVAGYGPLERGFAVDVDLPTTISLGGASIHVVGDVDLSRFIPNRAVGLAAVAALILGVVFSEPSLQKAVAALGGNLGHVRLSALSAMVVGADDNDRLVATIRAKLAAFGLAEQVAIKPNEAHELVLSGQLEGPEALAAWRAFLMKVDADVTLPPLSNQVRVLETAQRPPAIMSVWFGSEPRVMMSEDKSLGIGEATADGWKIRDIRPREVVIESPSHALVKVQL